MRQLLCSAVLAFAVLAAAPAQAAATYHLNSGGSSAGTTGSGYNRSYAFNDGTVGMTVSGWATTGLWGTLQSAQVNRFDTGMGVCNRREGLNCGSASHQVDNSLGVDFLLFSFEETVDLRSIVIDPYFLADRDVTYFVTEVDDIGSLSGLSLAQLASQWDTTAVHVEGGLGTGPLTIDLSARGKHLLFGAYSPHDNFWPDAFKVKAITYDPIAQVPEPASLGLLGTALAGVGLAVRRRRARA